MTTSGVRQRLLTVPPFHADQSRDFVPLPLRFRVLSGLWPLARTCTTPKIQLQQQRLVVLYGYKPPAGYSKTNTVDFPRRLLNKKILIFGISNKLISK